MSEATSKRSNTFGIIAVIIGVLLFMTPRFLLSLGMMALAIFVIVGLIRDGSKVFSLLGLGLGGLIFFFLFQESMAAEQMFQVRYEAECSSCNLSYTNATGGTDQEKEGYQSWQKTFSIKGDQFIHFSAQNNNGSGAVGAKIYVDDVLLTEETSSGEYAVASVSCQPKDVLSRK